MDYWPNTFQNLINPDNVCRHTYRGRLIYVTPNLTNIVTLHETSLLPLVLAININTQQ